MDGLNSYLADSVKWNYKWPINLTPDIIREKNCTDKGKLAVVQILPVLDTAPKIVYYCNCEMCLYAACKRQLIAVPDPSEKKLNQLQEFMDKTIMPEMRELLKDFHYSYDVWYNHLTAEQQREIDDVKMEDINKRNCSVFCKGEKQQADNPPPKNRCISALNDNHKYVMGPIIYALEQYMKDFKGYGGGQNWDDLAQTLDEWLESTWRLVQSDVSGMDRSVKMRLKEIVFNAIYKLVEDKVTHVDIETYRKHAYPVRTVMLAKQFSKDGLIDYGHSSIEATVFSGSCDTTLMNTIVTIILNRFVMEVILQLKKDEYGLKCKGDDNMGGVPERINNKQLVDAYGQCYYYASDIKNMHANLYGKHGFGLTLKFLQCSDHLDDADFCSTNAFYCRDCKKHRITRKIDRFVELTPWSAAIIPLSDKQRTAYKNNLHLSNLKWMKGLPIFTELNDKLKGDDKKMKPIFGNTKKRLPLSAFDQDWANKMFNKHDDKIYNLFGKSEFYSMRNQTGDIQPCCAKYYKKWLNDKLGLTEQMITIIQNDILNAKDEYRSMLLTEGLKQYTAYKKTTYFTR